ncbi:hypothetical protein KEM54_001104 [Ascosphaera aggregata]|nr:hypothetical protein KEM54_001104 [Ascosphaera aggregata]
MARMIRPAHRNPFEQLAHTQSLDSDPEGDNDDGKAIDGSTDDEGKQGLGRTSGSRHTRIAPMRTRAAANESVSSPSSATTDDVLSIGTLSTGVVDPQRFTAVPPALGRDGLPHIPDMRFEQGYLKSIRGAETWHKVIWITVRDQVFFPLVQGTLWTLVQNGLRYWNRGSHVRGITVGSRIRSWWKRNVMGVTLIRR